MQKQNYEKFLELILNMNDMKPSINRCMKFFQLLGEVCSMKYVLYKRSM